MQIIPTIFKTQGTKMLIIQRAALIATFFANILACSDAIETAQPIVIDYTTPRDVRKDRATGESQKPILIALARASNNQQKAIETLAERGLFYNLFINLKNRTVGYFTPDSTQNIHTTCETLRPRALGISAYTKDGFLQIRDVNTVAIAIGLVGDEKDFKDPESRAFFTAVIKAICTHHGISKVMSYPMLAVHSDGTYGRVCIKSHYMIDFKKLAKNSLGVWPRKKDSKIGNPFDLATDAGKTAAIVWTAQALNKTGMMAAVTSNNRHPQLQSAIMAFQQHHQLRNQDGTVDNETMLALNSILNQQQTLDPALVEIEPQPLETLTALGACAAGACKSSIADIEMP